MKISSFYKISIFLIVSKLSAQKIEFTSEVSKNSITTFENQKLLLLDFWATWCGPCVAATKQMEIFQEYNKDKIFIFSVTDETESKVKKYLEKKPIALEVVLDQKKESINKYSVVSRPYAVLLDLKGKLLWKGHPADLNQKLLNSFYEKSKNEVISNLSELVAFKKITEISLEKPHVVIDFNLKKETNPVDNFFEIEDSKVSFSGKLANLIAKITKKNIYGIEIENSLNYTVSIVCDQNDWNNTTEILNKICQKFDLDIEEIEKNQFGNEIIVENKTLLWKNTQFDWEDAPSNFMIGTDKITANDISIAEFSRILSEAKNKNYIYKGDDLTTYDWDFQFLYDDLMIEDLQSTFGIVIKPTTTLQKITKISKK